MRRSTACHRLFRLPATRHGPSLCNMNPGLCPLLRAMRLSCTLFLRVAALALPLIATADEPTVKTYTFKILDSQGSQLQAAVHRPPGDAVRPVVVFIHGGALMMGDRKLTPKAGSLLEALLNAGYAVVSID